MQQETIFYESLENIDDKSQLGLLAEAINQCITHAFGHEMPVEEVDDALKGALIVVAKEKDTVVGFCSLQETVLENFKNPELATENPQGQTLSFGAATVDKEYQGQGIYKELSRRRLEYLIKQKQRFLETTTQNPRVEKGITTLLNGYIAAGLIKNYTSFKHKVPGFFGRQLTQYPLDTAQTSFETLDLEAGDAYELIFEIHYF